MAFQQSLKLHPLFLYFFRVFVVRSVSATRLSIQLNFLHFNKTAQCRYHASHPDTKNLIRYAVCMTKFDDDSATITSTDLHVALQNAANFRGTGSSPSVVDEDAAVSFAQNCHFRSGRRYPRTHISFGGLCFDFVNETIFARLKQWAMDFISRDNHREKGDFLNADEIDAGNSHSIVWLFQKDNSARCLFVKSLGWRAIREAVYAKTQNNRDEILQCAQHFQESELYPKEVSVIKYSPERYAGIDGHRDEFATFGIVIDIIEECPGKGLTVEG